MTTPWPRQGVCGACGRPAQQFPSLKWEHHGNPLPQPEGRTTADRDRMIRRFPDDAQTWREFYDRPTEWDGLSSPRTRKQVKGT